MAVDKTQLFEKEKPSFKEYNEWMKIRHGIKDLKELKSYYNAVAEDVKLVFEKSEFWKLLRDSLEDYSEDYLKETEFELFKSDESLLPKFEIKPFSSFISKTFRKNIVENDRYPEKPEEGWILPESFFGKVNDIVRTMITVKYLDGVKFIIEKLEILCKDENITHEVTLEAKEEGYYAAHFIVKREFEIKKSSGFDTKKVIVPIEIQIATQLQEVIKVLLHKYYEERREKTSLRKVEEWKWDYGSTEFATNYLGHVLHYIEGMIVEIKNKQRKEL